MPKPRARAVAILTTSYSNGRTADSTESSESEKSEIWSRYYVVNLRNKKHRMVESEVREVRRTKPLSHNGTENFPSLATFLYAFQASRYIISS